MGKRKAKRPEGAPKFDLRIGDHVMLGAYGITAPGDWYFAVVLWVGDEDILVDQSDMCGQTFRDLKSLSDVRAVGDYSAMRDVQERARKAVAEKREAYEAAQAATEAARLAMWGTLDQIGAASVDCRKAAA